MLWPMMLDLSPKPLKCTVRHGNKSRNLQLDAFPCETRRSGMPSEAYLSKPFKMPPKANLLTPQQKRSQKAELARKLFKAALEKEITSSDEESEDEGGHWERIYESKKSRGAVSDNEGPTSKRRQGRKNSEQEEGNIIGAKRRDDGLECSVGDCVLLKAADGSVPWVGMIMQFTGADEDGDDCANFLCTRICRNQEFGRNAERSRVLQ